MPHTDGDMDAEIRYCTVKPKTKVFAIVEADWTRLKFDPAGNAKAVELVRKAGRNPFLGVDVKGELNKGTINVESISVEAPGTRSKISSVPGNAHE
jgi:hypothetical protein